MAKKQKPVYKGVEYDSTEEVEFVYWLEEAKAAGYIHDFTYHPKTFTLAESVRIDSPIFGMHKINDVEYTPDFAVFATPEQVDRLNLKFNHGLYFHRLHPTCFTAHIDIKGNFVRGSAPNASAATYSIKAAWMFDKHKLYINKVIARDMAVKNKTTGARKVTKPGFFSKTWCPEAAAWMKARKERTRIAAFAGCKLIGEV